MGQTIKLDFFLIFFLFILFKLVFFLKIFLVYENSFWNEDDEINLVRFYENKSELVDELNHVNESSESWLRNVFNFEPVANQENTLVVWMGGLTLHESLPDETIIKDINSLLKRFLPHKDIPNPIKILR